MRFAVHSSIHASSSARLSVAMRWRLLEPIMGSCIDPSSLQREHARDGSRITLPPVGFRGKPGASVRCETVDTHTPLRLGRTPLRSNEPFSLEAMQPLVHRGAFHRELAPVFRGEELADRVPKRKTTRLNSSHLG